MSDLFGNHIVGFTTRRLIFLYEAMFPLLYNGIIMYLLCLQSYIFCLVVLLNLTVHLVYFFFVVLGLSISSLNALFVCYFFLLLLFCHNIIFHDGCVGHVYIGLSLSLLIYN